MEHKYESDLTKKEKRQMEIEKLKSMNFPEKLDTYGHITNYGLPLHLGLSPSFIWDLRCIRECREMSL